MIAYAADILRRNHPASRLRLSGSASRIIEISPAELGPISIVTASGSLSPCSTCASVRQFISTDLPRPGSPWMSSNR